MNMQREMSARRADYVAWNGGERAQQRRPLPEGLEITPCGAIDALSEVLGALRKLKHDKNFLSKIFESRCKQLYPRDLMVATVTTKKGGKRPIGVLRRSMQFDKKKRSADLYIDFVWVLPDYRSCGLGRHLMGAGLVTGRPKDVRLQLAGSEANKAALGLYQSLGFVWDSGQETAKEKTEMVLRADLAAQTVAKIDASRAQPCPPAPAPTLTPVRVALTVDGRGHVALCLALVAQPAHDGATSAGASAPTGASTGCTGSRRAEGAFPCATSSSLRCNAQRDDKEG